MAWIPGVAHACAGALVTRNHMCIYTSITCPNTRVQISICSTQVWPCSGFSGTPHALPSGSGRDWVRREETGRWGSAFEYCRGKCRTHKFSTVHENAYLAPDIHCYSSLGGCCLCPLRGKGGGGGPTAASLLCASADILACCDIPLPHQAKHGQTVLT